MRTPTRTTLALAALLALSALPARAQTAVSFSMGFGSLFDGVSLGIGFGVRTPGPLFFGTSLGLYRYSPWEASPYGIYSDNDYGWGMGYRRHAAWVASSCWDPYWGSYSWDSWDGFGCTGWASYWTPGWWNGYGYGSSILVSGYWRDPFSTPWGPYWAYDPWGSYWNGYWTRHTGSWYGGRGYYGGGGYYGGRRVGVYRPATGTPTYKEAPRSPTGRTAKRRAGVAAPAPASGSSRSAQPGAVPARRPAADPPAMTAPSRPRRPSDRARPADRWGGEPRGPSVRTTPLRSDPSSAPARVQRPSTQQQRGAARPTPLSRPSDRLRSRAEQAWRESAARTQGQPASRPGRSLTSPSARRAPQSWSAPAPRRDPAARAPVSRAPSARAAPAPSRAEPRARTYTAPSRPQVRSAPRSVAPRSRPTVRSRPEVRSRPAVRRSSGARRRGGGR